MPSDLQTDLPRIYVALDTPDFKHALSLAEGLSALPLGLKIGLEFFNVHGAQGVADIQAAFPDLSVFLDLKYHDIPNTVAGAVRSVTSVCKPDYLNVHATGGAAMMRAAKAACPIDVRLLAVTVLTSLDDHVLTQAGFAESSDALVPRLANYTRESGVDGIVCSALEIEKVRRTCGDEFVLMVPGIRPEGSAKDDQKRVMTPAEALSKGATHLVIGRPITKADNPRQAAENILATLS